MSGPVKMHVSAPSRRPGVPRSLYRGIAWAVALEAAGAVVFVLAIAAIAFLLYLGQPKP